MPALPTCLAAGHISCPRTRPARVRLRFRPQPCLRTATAFSRPADAAPLTWACFPPSYWVYLGAPPCRVLSVVVYVPVHPVRLLVIPATLFPSLAVCEVHAPPPAACSLGFLTCLGRPPRWVGLPGLKILFLDFRRHWQLVPSIIGGVHPGQFAFTNASLVRVILLPFPLDSVLTEVVVAEAG